MHIIRKRSKEQLLNKKRTIVLFGGAFNPPHKGHVAMVRTLLRRQDIHEIWIIPVFRHPFEKGLVPYSARFHMCRLAFRSLPRVTVKRIEEKLGGVSYTVKTLKFLTKIHPRTRFMLVLGADSYRARNQWKDFKTIEQMADLIVFERGKKSKIPDVSSTEFRTGELGVVPKSVRQYIQKKGLYGTT